MSNPILLAEQLTKVYRSADKSLTVLDNVSFSVEEGTSIAIIGPSGSGKTTLLGLCAGLDTATSGSVSVMGYKLGAMDEDDRAYIRNQYVGFIFQNFQLLSTLTALENVTVPMELRGERGAARKAKDLLERVGLADRLQHYPTQLSGGSNNGSRLRGRSLPIQRYCLLMSRPGIWTKRTPITLLISFSQ